ncbi:MAG: RHS repeat-associated core domain-containing protein [Desulfatiglandales bacterium]
MKGAVFLMQKAILRLMIILIPLCFTSHLSARTIHLGTIKVPTYKVTGITPELTEDGSLMLTAEINRPVKPPLRIIWRFKGDDHGYAFLSDEGESVLLSIGEQETGVVVEACLAEGERSGGCRSITLTAALLDQVQDEAAWKDLLVPDFTEPDFICQVLDDDRYQYVFYEVASRVHTVTGEYLREKEDLAVKVPGGMLSIKRQYQSEGWTWDHERHDLILVRGPEGGIESIRKGTTSYRADPDDEGVFTDGIYHIHKTDEGFRWESKHGQWKRYNLEGRLTAYGDRNGVTGRILFKDGQPFCLSDRNNQGVLWFDYDNEGLLRTVYDQNNRSVTYRYREGLLSAVTDVLGNETRFSYDEEGRLAEVIEPEGARTRITYDQLDRVVSIRKQRREAEPESTAGHTFTWAYDRDRSLYYVGIDDPSGKLTEIWSNKEGQARRVDINGHTVHKIVETDNTLEVTDSRGLTTRKTFDQRRNLLEVVHPDGSRIKREYEPRFNRKTKEINENGIITLFSYDDKGNLIQKTEASGTLDERVTLYTHDPDGNLLTVHQLRNDKTKEAITRYTYDAFGNRIMETDPEGNTTEFQYDALGNVITRTDPTGSSHQFTHDPAGRLIQIEDPLGNTTRFVYDAQGRKTVEIDPLGNKTRYAYDEKDNLILMTDALGNETRFDYDESGRLIRSVDPEGVKTTRFWDDQDRLIAAIDGAGNEIRTMYETPTATGCPTCASGRDRQPDRIEYPTFWKEFLYDARGRKVEEQWGDDKQGLTPLVTLFEYDPAGNLISKTDREGRTTTHAYDSLNRLIRVTDPLGNHTTYTYDSRDNLVALTDANGNTTRFTYDRNNRMIRETRPMGQETSYSYDGRGDLKEKIDAKGHKAEHVYDPAGRLVNIRYFGSEDQKSPVKTVAFTHDEAGNLISYDDGTTSGRYVHDALNRKTQEVVDYGRFTKSFSYAHYRNGQKREFTGPDSILYTYTYDEANRLSSIEIPKLGPITYTDYQWTRPARITLPGGTTRTFAYDLFMRINRITSQDPGGHTILDYLYTHDGVDNILTKDTEHGEYRYTYDALDRLTGAINPTLPDEAYTYDPVGNRLTSEDAEKRWSYNENNELLGYNGVTFRYDENASTIKKATASGVSRYFYNEDNRLSRVEDEKGTVISSYYYDPFGRRLWKETGGKKVYFLYSDEGLIGEYDDRGRETKTYGFIPGSTWTTDPVFMREKGRYHFYHNDHLGTPQKITAKDGRVVWSAKASSFGGFQVEIAYRVNEWGFPGQYFDEETGLQYNFHRLYDPETGRYLKVDPIGLKGDGIIGRMPNHLFLYSENNPVNKIDPKGMFAYHGNFCGPGHGDLNHDMPLPFSKDGGIDQCCYEHDKCYNEGGISTPYTSPLCTDDPDQKNCDRKLCNCLRKTKPPEKFILKKWGMQKIFVCFNKTSTIIQIEFEF